MVGGGSGRSGSVSEALSLNTPLSAGDVAVNLSISASPISPDLRTTLVFEGGRAMVEEYNPPCARMSKHLSETPTTAPGDRSPKTPSLRRAFSRGLVGVVEVSDSCRPGARNGAFRALPKWLRS